MIKISYLSLLNQYSSFSFLPFMQKLNKKPRMGRFLSLSWLVYTIHVLHVLLYTEAFLHSSSSPSLPSSQYKYKVQRHSTSLFANSNKPLKDEKNNNKSQSNNKNLAIQKEKMNRMDFTKYISMFSVAAICSTSLPISNSLSNSRVVNALPMEIDKSIQPKSSTLLPSGVKVETLIDGDGPAPAVGDLVAIRFQGTCNGVEFDNLYKTEEPYYYRPGAGTLMPGIEEILPKMRVGDRWKVTVPGALAFGKKGRPASAGRPRIPPMATVVFDISMVGIPGKEEEIIMDFDDSDESITKYD